MKDKKYNQKNKNTNGMDNTSIHRYNDPCAIDSIKSEDDALRYLAGILVEAHIKIKHKSHV